MTILTWLSISGLSFCTKLWIASMRVVAISLVGVLIIPANNTKCNSRLRKYNHDTCFTEDGINDVNNSDHDHKSPVPRAGRLIDVRRIDSACRKQA